jgi:hypothetical protein
MLIIYLFMSHLMTLSVISDYKEMNDLMIVNNVLKRTCKVASEAQHKSQQLPG